jgi:lysyl-tRNA synthetase class 2
MASLEELKQTRLAKLDLLQKAGMEPYPVSVPRDFSLREARERFSELKDSHGEGGKEASLCGRIMAIRGQGAILFVVLDDGTGTFQAVMKKDSLDEKFFTLFKDACDIERVWRIFCNSERRAESPCELLVYGRKVTLASAGKVAWSPRSG